MHNECICAVKSWRKGLACHDCIFVEMDPDALGMAGLDIAHVQLFFSGTFDGVKHEPDVMEDGTTISVIHLDTIVQAAHLLPVFKKEIVSRDLSFSDTLDKFQLFYVNKFIDHHAFEIAF